MSELTINSEDIPMDVSNKDLDLNDSGDKENIKDNKLLNVSEPHLKSGNMKRSPRRQLLTKRAMSMTRNIKHEDQKAFVKSTGR